MLNEYDYPDIVDQTFRGLVKRWENITLLSVERLFSLYGAARYIVQSGLPGSIVECGTYKGGSMGLTLETLMAYGATDREVYLFDTFDGFPEDVDEITIDGGRFQRKDWITESFRADVEANLQRTGYPRELVHICAGRVEDTIPDMAPATIAMLHLDTDYYGATLHQLNHLFPRLVSGGFMQVDDYGHFLGCRKAVDEYFDGSPARRMLLNRIDYTGRAGCRL